MDAAGAEACGGGEDIADEALAGDVGGVGLAGEEDLQAADLLGELGEALGIVEEQAGALVGGDAAGEAEGQHLGVELLPGAPGDLGEQALLGLLVAVGDLGRRDAVDGTEVVVVVTPLGNLLVEQRLHRTRRARSPRGRRW